MLLILIVEIKAVGS